jgi:hypothetical protein
MVNGIPGRCRTLPSLLTNVVVQTSNAQVHVSRPDLISFSEDHPRRSEKIACLQLSMSLAKYVGGWSLPKIGRFYNGRHQTAVCTYNSVRGCRT